MDNNMQPIEENKARVSYIEHCHCGNIKFEASATRNLTITLCNCGICFKSGHQELMVKEEHFKLHCGQEFLKPYQFGNCIADHTFYRPRSHQAGYFSVNARCLDLNQAEHIEYIEFDGQNWEESIAAGKHKLAEQL